MVGLGESQQGAAPGTHLSRALLHNSTQVMTRGSSLGLPPPHTLFTEGKLRPTVSPLSQSCMAG